ncbi:MAG TPA: tetratricopeptide repeat protein [Armatimonadota bacterium]|nr:tetratricopeptide repeat protein [Armatimonadota bacterium]
MSDAQQLFQQARTSRVNGDYDQAIALLQQAIEAMPNCAEAHMELGLAYCFSGLFDESIDELKHAASLDSINPEICLHLAKTYTMLGMYEEGAAAFRKVLTLSSVGDKCYDEASKQLSYFESMF